ncbi:MAG TPA: hemolysin family protein [Chitinophagaceae bacterium]|nr:hemolysin family protein [Chitinophagaceae bacterium]MCC6634038.1 HlyC/CorC family transporter [Chitinophagaceae bacterium]HMZ46679.1 hemolysin family protein [Chitinophagaceae bacterium]HNE93411.1 hemolysin family protein [Chitinophagaceae bacterium]HNF29225.1 hemolysin family protein [Chitinophagaceae bacterium]
MAEIFIIIGLIIINGLFSMAEIALVSARKARLEAQANKGNEEAERALKLANKPDSFLSTVQIGITLIGILTGFFSGENIKNDVVIWLQKFEILQPHSDKLATALVVVVITYFTLVLGELLPKRIGLSNPEVIAKMVATPMMFISKIAFPFIWLLNKSTNTLSKLFNILPNNSQVTEDEIKAIINEGTEQGTIEEAEQEIIERVFRLGDRNITSLMTHRSDIIWLDVHKTIGELKSKFEEGIFSVYPVCDGSIDNIKGSVTIKDLFISDSNTNISTLVKQPLYVPENNTAYQVLEKFKETKIHHCYIVNEYGSLEGMITLNDILEAIVGDIPEITEDNYEIIEREDGSLLADAQIPFIDFLHKVGKEDWINDEEDFDFDTLAGFILHHTQEIPTTGERLQWRDFEFEIIDMDKHRIDKILISYKK